MSRCYHQETHNETWRGDCSSNNSKLLSPLVKCEGLELIWRRRTVERAKVDSVSCSQLQGFLTPTCVIILPGVQQLIIDAAPRSSRPSYTMISRDNPRTDGTFCMFTQTHRGADDVYHLSPRRRSVTPEDWAAPAWSSSIRLTSPRTS